MTILDKLHDVQRLKHEIEELRREEQRLFSIATGGAIRYDMERVQTSPRPDRMESIIVNLTEVRSKELELLQQRMKLYTEIMDAIDEIDNPLQRQVLQMHYVEGYSLIDISDMLGFSYIHIRQQISTARKKLKERTKTNNEM